MTDLTQELTILLKEEPVGIARLLLALSTGSIRGAAQDPPYYEQGRSLYYSYGPYGVMFDEWIVAYHKTFTMRARMAPHEGQCPITPLELATGFFIEGEVTLEHQKLIDQIEQIQQKETIHA